MNIDLQDVTETRKTLAVTLEASEIQAEEKQLLQQFSKMAKVPGFRPGKAPADMIRKRFAKQIGDELKQRVISKAYQDGLKESKLELINVVNLEDSEISPNADAKLTFTVDVRPEFEIADYKGIEVTGLSVEVSEDEIAEVVKGIRSERAEFSPVEREAQKGDYVKFSHEGSIDGQPISEIAADKPVYAKMPQTWEEVGAEHGLIPGMSDALAGLKPGDKKDVQVEFPADFSVEALRGKQAVYAVEVLEVRERKLPELDEAFFKSQGVKDLAELQERVKSYVEGRKRNERSGDLRRQVIEQLLAKVEFPLPESLVEAETQRGMREVVSNNVRQGVPQEELEKNKEEIHGRARIAAVDAVKLQLILTQIAKKEEIEVKDEDFSRYIFNQAYRSGQKPDAVAKELRKNQDQVRSLHSSLLYDKTLEFLVGEAKVAESQEKKED